MLLDLQKVIDKQFWYCVSGHIGICWKLRSVFALNTRWIRQTALIYIEGAEHASLEKTMGA